MSQNKTGKNKRKKKKGTGLIVVCVLLLIFLVAVLGVTILLLLRAGNGETVGFGGKTGGNTQNVSQTVLATQGAAQTSAANDSEAQTEAQTEGAAESDAATGQAQAAGQALMMEPQTYETDENGNMIIPARQAGSMETEPAWEYVLEKTGDTVLDDANYLAAMYDYDGAIAKIQSVSGYESNAAYTAAIADYEQRKSEAVVYSDNSTIPHIFFHTLVVDTSRAFDDNIAISKQDGMNKVKDYNYVMTTVDEFCRILEEMYSRGYVLVSIYDVASYETQADGTQVMKHQPIYLPEGKKPFVLSVDDVSYYEYMEGHGFASKLVVGEDGTPTSEYTNPDGSVTYGSFDVVPILDDFVETHPDFSYRGAKGIIALTGYEGIFGYRTSDFWYNSNCDYFDQYFSWNLENNTKKKQTMYYDNPNIEQDKESAKQVAQACRDDGWLFASHTWGHNKVGDSGSYERFESDARLWDREVKPLLGDVDIIIYPQGEDLYEGSWRGYDPENQKYQLLKELGFSYFCSVDSNLGWTQLGSEYFRMGRANVDGQRMWEAISSYVDPSSGAVDRLSALIDSRLVFDWSRPTPVEK
jgi:flagellar basal body-associated protein FliL